MWLCDVIVGKNSSDLTLVFELKIKKNGIKTIQSKVYSITKTSVVKALFKKTKKCIIAPLPSKIGLNRNWRSIEHETLKVRVVRVEKNSNFLSSNCLRNSILVLAVLKSSQAEFTLLLADRANTWRGSAPLAPLVIPRLYFRAVFSTTFFTLFLHGGGGNMPPSSFFKSLQNFLCWSCPTLSEY